MSTKLTQLSATTARIAIASDALDTVAKIPEHKITACRIEAKAQDGSRTA